MSSEEFMSFEDALRELRLKDEELKRLVSEGEIRAFREGDTMKLRKGDVDALRSELSGGEVVDLGDEGDEIVFEDAGLAEDETGMATEEISDVDTIIEDDVEEIDLEEEEPEPVPVAAPIRRTPTRAALQEEDEHEDMLTRFALIAGAIVAILALPLLFAVSSGRVTTLAQTVAGLFGHQLR